MVSTLCVLTVTVTAGIGNGFSCCRYGGEVLEHLTVTAVYALQKDNESRSANALMKLTITVDEEPRPALV